MPKFKNCAHILMCLMHNLHEIDFHCHSTNAISYDLWFFDCLSMHQPFQWLPQDNLGGNATFYIQQQPLKWLNWISKTGNVSCMSKALSVNLSLQKNIFRQSNFSIVLLAWFKVQITLYKHMFTYSEFFLSLLRIHQYS